MKTTPLLSRDQPPVALTDRLEFGIMPLINLVFLLLMFFLVAGVIAEDQLPELPGNDAAQAQEEPKVDFTIDESGQLLRKGEPVDLERLDDIVKAGPAGEPTPEGKREWRIGADQDLSMAALEDVLMAFNRAGIDRVQLLTEPVQ